MKTHSAAEVLDEMVWDIALAEEMKDEREQINKALATLEADMELIIANTSVSKPALIMYDSPEVSEFKKALITNLAEYFKREG